MRKLLAVVPAIAICFASAEAVAEQAVAPAAAVVDNLHYSDKWRLEVSEGADKDGILRFRLTPKGGTPLEVTVRLKDGRGEDGCARDIRDAFKSALDRKRYKVELDDGEDVLVKKHRGRPDFAIELVEDTVKGTRVKLDRE